MNRDQERLTLLVRAGEIFHQSLDMTATLNNVARVAVESFADLCLFDLIDERLARLFVTASAHRDPSQEKALAGVADILYVEEFRTHPVVQVTRTGHPFFLPHIDEATISEHAASRQHASYMRRFGYRSKIVVPVIAHDHLFGALTFVRTSIDKEFDQDDLGFAIELGRRAGLAVANAKQFQREQYVAETLQRAFLPSRFPSSAEIEITAHYRPGSNEADVGGDWYDAFENSHGDLLVSIGDITGKGLEAARLMVLMRQAVRVAALDTRDPSAIAQICNRLLLAENHARLASAFIGVFQAGTRKLRYVSAGHPPPLLRDVQGNISWLESPSPPLGAFQDALFEVHEKDCPDESMLVLYTDGVVEISRDALAGEHDLEKIVSANALPHVANPASFIDQSVALVHVRDDMAILVVNFTSREKHWKREAADARAAYAMRDEYVQELLKRCRMDEASIATCNLIFAELVGNTVRHAPGPLSLSLELRSDTIVLHVLDTGPGFVFAPALPGDIWAESGRGLYLLSILAKDVQVERLPKLGTHVQVTLPVLCPSSGLELVS